MQKSRERRKIKKRHTRLIRLPSRSLAIDKNFFDWQGRWWRHTLRRLKQTDWSRATKKVVSCHYLQPGACLKIHVVWWSADYVNQFALAECVFKIFVNLNQRRIFSKTENISFEMCPSASSWFYNDLAKLPHSVYCDVFTKLFTQAGQANNSLYMYVIIVRQLD